METLNNTEILRKEQLDFHKQALNQYICFVDSEESNVIPCELAYSILKHATYIERLSGDSVLINQLKKIFKTNDDLKNFISDVCKYISGNTLAETANQISDFDVLNDEQIEQAVDIIFERYALQIVWDTANDYFHKTIREDNDLRQKFVLAKCNITEVDYLFEKRPDIFCVAARELSPYLSCAVKKSNEKNLYWYNQLIEFDHETEKIMADKKLLFEYLGLSKKKIKDIDYDLTNVIKIFDDIFNPNPVYELALAAGTGKRSPFLVWEKPINELKTFFESCGKVSDSAELDKQIRQFSSGFSASWHINTLNIKGKFIVYIIGTNDLKVIGLAEYDSETDTITLDKIIKENKFKEYIDTPEKILLILKK